MPTVGERKVIAVKITKAQVVVSGFQDALLRLLKGWRSPPMQNEFEYRDSLYERLRDALPDDTAVEKEYRHGGTTSDLYVRWKSLLGSSEEVFFELKHNLMKKGQLNLLSGQILELNPKHRNIVIVLTGERDRALVGRLKEQFGEFLGESGFFGRETWMAIVEGRYYTSEVVPDERAAGRQNF